MSTLRARERRVAIAAFIGAVLSMSAATRPAQAEHSPSGGSSSFSDPATVSVNSLVEKAWQENGVRPAKEARDHVWCRRVFLDLIGRIPTVDELDAYMSGSRRTRDQELVDQLLGSEYVEEYAGYWSTVWANALIGRAGGNDRRDPTSRAGMNDYLRRSFLENKPYDVFCRELVEVERGSQPGMENYNGAVNFLIGKMEENGVQATAKTAQIFLGMAVQCTQCHNHPFNEYRQNQFWELHAFLRQTRVQTE